MAETRPISQRRTELSDRRDILRRLLFLFLVFDLLGGIILLPVGLTKGNMALVLVGGALLASGLALWFIRHRLGVQDTLAEIRANPFKAARVPKE